MTKDLVAHFTDSHIGQRLVMDGEMDRSQMRYDPEPDEHGAHLRLILDDIAQKGITNVIFGGDIGSKQAVGCFFDLLKTYPFGTSGVLGNHDDYGDVARYWNVEASQVNRKLCYSRSDSFWKFVFLDTSDNALGEEQLVWLRRELDGASQVALFLHHPILAIDTPLERAGAALRDRQELKTVLSGADCEVSVFCGHYHMIDEAVEGNIRQFVSPAVSYQIVKQTDRLRVDKKTFGYRILEISGTQIRTEAVLLTEA